MVALRKALSYSKKKVRPFTRKSAKKKKAFIKAVPQSKIVKFNMGDQAGFLAGKHNYCVRLVAEQEVQIRDNSLEACRQMVNKLLDKHLPGAYFFTIKVFPHHILRENKLAAGAGADRLSSGMRHSFGVTVGRAAIVPVGKEILNITCTDDRAARIAKKTLEQIKSKLPCQSRIIFEKIGK